MSDIKFKPMLAYTIEDTSKLNYPVIVSKKLDGIRVVILDGVVYSRSMKPIRSKVVQELFGKHEYNGLDGELLYGDWNADNVFNLTTQAVMSTELKSQFDKNKISMAVFDYVLKESAYQDRYVVADYIVDECGNQMQLLDHFIMYNEEELLAFEKKTLEEGFEGIMVRAVDGKYKQGRSTAKEGLIGKLKRFSDDEAIIVDFEEKMHNTNEKKTNELGYSERSSSKDGLVGADTLGALICDYKGITINIGSGFDDVWRDEIWNMLQFLIKILFGILLITKKVIILYKNFLIMLKEMEIIKG